MYKPVYLQSIYNKEIKYILILQHITLKIQDTSVFNAKYTILCFTFSVLVLVQEEAHPGCQFLLVLIELYLPDASRPHLDMPCPWI